MSESAIYRVLDWPWVYRLSQWVLAPGMERIVVKEFSNLIQQFPSSQQLLDVGCGPTSWLWRLGLHPVGLDLSSSYSLTFRRKGEPAVTGSATTLPFKTGVFDGVWSVFLFHHLTDTMAEQVVQEMLRVCRVGGYVVIFDGVMPDSILRRPSAWLIRKYDRGGFFRREERFRDLFVGPNWNLRRITYAATALEGMICVTRKK